MALRGSSLIFRNSSFYFSKISAHMKLDLVNIFLEFRAFLIRLKDIGKDSKIIGRYCFPICDFQYYINLNPHIMRLIYHLYQRVFTNNVVWSKQGEGVWNGRNRSTCFVDARVSHKSRIAKLNLVYRPFFEVWNCKFFIFFSFIYFFYFDFF